MSTPSQRADLQARLQEALAGPCGLRTGERIAVACSGGGDSVALLDLLHATRERNPLHEVLFVDHGLRDVSLEAASSRAAAARVGVRWRSLRVDVPDSGNLQGEARRCRYEALAAAVPADTVVATGHTMDDQAETVLQRLLRGSGLRGLVGIRARDDSVIRPLLTIRREELRTLDLDFAEDPTNATPRFLRNRIRHAVMPLLLEENPRAVEALALVATQAAVEQTLVGGIMERLEGAEPDLRGLEPRVVETWLRWWLHDADPLAHPSRGAVQDLAERLVGGIDGRISLGGGLAGTSKDGRVGLTGDDDPRRRVVAPGPGVYGTSGVSLFVGACAAAADLKDVGRRMHVWIETEQMRWPLTLQREPGRGARIEALGWAVRDGTGVELPLQHGAAKAPPNRLKSPFVVELVF